MKTVTRIVSLLALVAVLERQCLTGLRSRTAHLVNIPGPQGQYRRRYSHL